MDAVTGLFSKLARTREACSFRAFTALAAADVDIPDFFNR